MNLLSNLIEGSIRSSSRDLFETIQKMYDKIICYRVVEKMKFHKLILIFYRKIQIYTYFYILQIIVIIYFEIYITRDKWTNLSSNLIEGSIRSSSRDLFETIQKMHDKIICYRVVEKMKFHKLKIANT